MYANAKPSSRSPINYLCGLGFVGGCSRCWAKHSQFKMVLQLIDCFGNALPLQVFWVMECIKKQLQEINRDYVTVTTVGVLHLRQYLCLPPKPPFANAKPSLLEQQRENRYCCCDRIQCNCCDKPIHNLASCRCASTAASCY